MANTYTLIASSTVGSGGAANITLSTIPSTYTDLAIMCSLRGAAAANEVSVTLQFNGSSSGYSTRWIRGNGAAASSGTDTYGTDEFYMGEIPGSTATASTFGNAIIYMPNYTTSNNKSISVDSVSENNATTAWAYLTAGLWSNSAAITSILLQPTGGSNFAQYSTAYLYGISNS